MELIQELIPASSSTMQLLPGGRQESSFLTCLSIMRRRSQREHESPLCPYGMPRLLPTLAFVFIMSVFLSSFFPTFETRGTSESEYISSAVHKQKNSLTLSPSAEESVIPRKINVFLKGVTLEREWVLGMLSASNGPFSFQRVSTVEEADLAFWELDIDGWPNIIATEAIQRVSVYWSGENTDFNAIKTMLGGFDLFSGHMLTEEVNSDSYARLPYYFLRIFDSASCWLPDDREMLFNPSLNTIPEWMSRPRNISFMASHLSYPREIILRKLEETIGRVDCPLGACGASNQSWNPSEEDMKGSVPIPGVANPNKDHFLRQTRFNVCPENSAGSGYVTEKLYDAFMAGSIPIYWPSNELIKPEPWLLNEKRILFYSNDTPNDILELLTNEERRNGFFSQPILQAGAKRQAQGLCQSFSDLLFTKLDKLLKSRKHTTSFCDRNLTQSKSQDGQDSVIYHTFFKHSCNGVFLEVGAADGISNSNTYAFENDLGWRGLLIEASVSAFEKLSKRTDRANSAKIHGAIGPKEGNATFIDIKGPQSQLSCIKEFASSEHLDRIDREMNATGGGEIKETLIHVKPLSAWLSMNGIFHINFFSLDVEGAELSVLKTVDFARFVFDVITVETNGNEEELVSFLTNEGFQLHTKTELDLIFCSKRVCP
jgi:FkbM family methyltransferase